LASAGTVALLFNHIICYGFRLLFFLTVLPSHTGLEFVLKELIIVLLILVFGGVALVGRKRASETADTRSLVVFAFLQYFGISYLLWTFILVIKALPSSSMKIFFHQAMWFMRLSCTLSTVLPANLSLAIVLLFECWLRN